MTKIQAITTIVSILLLVYVFRLIIKGKLRIEYSLFWIGTTLTLVIFAFWTKGLELLAKKLEVYEAPNLVFTAAIFSIFIYLLHLSVVNSKLQRNNKKLAQEIALLNEQLKNTNNDK
ncbi:MAG: DUF2304 domain-containing protein [Flavobacteriales bacterium]